MHARFWLWQNVVQRLFSLMYSKSIAGLNSSSNKIL